MSGFANIFCINYLKFRTKSDDHEGHLTKIFQVISVKNTNNLCAQNLNIQKAGKYLV